MKKIVTVVGARPQFIKASVVSHAIEKKSTLKEKTVHTGQHYDANMSDVFFDELEIKPPAYKLDIHGGSHGDMTGRMIIELERILMSENPDAVLVYGDTNSTIAGALAAVKLDMPVAHVEAGLRSFNTKMPEEINRIVTDRISRWLFAPTNLAVRNLFNEGIESANIIKVGDVMLDAALHFGTKASDSAGALSATGLRSKEYMLATIHRQENTDNPENLKIISEAFAMIAKEIPIIWPVHPRTKSRLVGMGLYDDLGGDVRLIDPVSYLEMLRLEKYALLIATDSGGVQKEAFFHKVPCVTLREETEWVELVEAGWNRLVPLSDARTVAENIRSALGLKGANISLYGDGNAATKIADFLAAKV